MFKKWVLVSPETKSVFFSTDSRRQAVYLADVHKLIVYDTAYLIKLGIEFDSMPDPEEFPHD